MLLMTTTLMPFVLLLKQLVLLVLNGMSGKQTGLVLLQLTPLFNNGMDGS